MARPIPQFLLIHSATHKYGAVSDDGWGNPTFADTRELKRVRFEPTSRLVLGKDNKEWQLSMLMFYDERNSRPRGVRFMEGEQIEFDGQTYTVVANDRLHDESKQHHQEVGLV